MSTEWINRLDDEQEELGQRIAKLTMFLTDELRMQDLTELDIQLLTIQLDLMNSLLRVLNLRFDRAKGFTSDN